MQINKGKKVQYNTTGTDVCLIQTASRERIGSRKSLVLHMTVVYSMMFFRPLNMDSSTSYNKQQPCTGLRVAKTEKERNSRFNLTRLPLMRALRAVPFKKKLMG